jgi:hypothetical protein
MSVEIYDVDEVAHIPSPGRTLQGKASRSEMSRSAFAQSGNFAIDRSILKSTETSASVS